MNFANFIRVVALTAPLVGCAFSYLGDDHRVHVLGLASLTTANDQGKPAIAGDYVKFKVFGIWLDTAFSSSFLSFGYGRVAAARLRSSWRGPTAEPTPWDRDIALSAMDSCEDDTGGIWFVNCSLPLEEKNTNGGHVMDQSVVGLGFGTFIDVTKVTLGYSRNIAVVVGGDALICGDPIGELSAWADNAANNGTRPEACEAA